MIQLINKYTHDKYIINRNQLYKIIANKYNDVTKLVSHSNFIKCRAYQQLHAYSNILFAIKYTDAKRVFVNDFVCNLIVSTLDA